MSRVFWIGFLVCLILALLACSESTTTPKTESLIYQVGRCQGHQGTAALAEDSCFDAEFTQNLLINFCLVANCCPDTNRFALSTSINNDTISIVAVDTAGNLCSCDCDYKAHAEFQNLPLSQYLVLCSFNGSIVYRETVIRTRTM
jgi:hypothetical protein